MKKVFIFTLYFISINFVLQAQNNQHSTLWLKQTIVHKFDEKNRIELELIHRRQSFFDQNVNNPFCQKWINASRFTYFRQVNPKIILSLSPLSIWQNKGLINQHGDLSKTPQIELRTTLGEETKIPLHSKFDFLQRNQIELRWQKAIGTTDFNYINRFRTRYLLKYNASKKISMTIGDEFFVHFKQNITIQNLFDQNRIIFNTSYQITKYCKIELGYIYIHQKRKSIDVIDHINTYNVSSVFFL